MVISLSEEISKTKERVLKRIEERRKMLITFIICIAIAVISVLILVLMCVGFIDLQSAFSSHLLAGLIRVLFLVAFFASIIIGIANIREYYVFNASGLFDLITVLVITLFLAYFLFDFPTGIADTLSTLGGCSLIMVYLYLIQD